MRYIIISQLTTDWIIVADNKLQSALLKVLQNAPSIFNLRATTSTVDTICDKYCKLYFRRVLEYKREHAEVAFKQ